MKKLSHILKAELAKMQGSPGLLFEQDDRDHVDEQLGVFGRYEPKHDKLSYYRYHYSQNPNNTCTQAGVALALSEQMSVRWSIDAITKMMVRQGKISGNGFASQRPPMAVACDHGLIPEHRHPDVPHETWGRKKVWTPSVNQAYEKLAPLYKMTEYKKLRNEGAVIEALDNGFVPIVASKWYSKMNRPLPPNFFLRFEGMYIGGHQYRISGYRKRGADFENGQSFGDTYGDKGKSYNETLFGSGYYEVWIVEYNGSPLLPLDVLLPVFLEQHEGLLVKSHDWHEDPRCYVIQNGKKRHVSGSDEMKTFFALQSKVGLTRVNQKVLDAVPEGEPYPLT